METNLSSQKFPIVVTACSICRGDLLASLTKFYDCGEEILLPYISALTDEDMEKIAEELSNLIDNTFEIGDLIAELIGYTDTALDNIKNSD